MHHVTHTSTPAWKTTQLLIEETQLQSLSITIKPKHSTRLLISRLISRTHVLCACIRKELLCCYDELNNEQLHVHVHDVMNLYNKIYHAWKKLVHVLASIHENIAGKDTISLHACTCIWRHGLYNCLYMYMYCTSTYMYYSSVLKDLLIRNQCNRISQPADGYCIPGSSHTTVAPVVSSRVTPANWLRKRNLSALRCCTSWSRCFSSSLRSASSLLCSRLKRSIFALACSTHKHTDMWLLQIQHISRSDLYLEKCV